MAIGAVEAQPAEICRGFTAVIKQYFNAWVVLVGAAVTVEADGGEAAWVVDVTPDIRECTSDESCRPAIRVDSAPIDRCEEQTTELSRDKTKVRLYARAFPAGIQRRAGLLPAWLLAIDVSVAVKLPSNMYIAPPLAPEFFVSALDAITKSFPSAYIPPPEASALQFVTTTPVIDIVPDDPVTNSPPPFTGE